MKPSRSAANPVGPFVGNNDGRASASSWDMPTYLRTDRVPVMRPGHPRFHREGPIPAGAADTMVLDRNGMLDHRNRLHPQVRQRPSTAAATVCSRQRALDERRYALKNGSSVAFREDGPGNGVAPDGAAPRDKAQLLARRKHGGWGGKWERRESRCRLGSQKEGWHADTDPRLQQQQQPPKRAIVRVDALTGNAVRMRPATAAADGRRPGGLPRAHVLHRVRRHPDLHGDPALRDATGAGSAATLGGVHPVPDLHPAAQAERAARRDAHGAVLAAAAERRPEGAIEPEQRRGPGAIGDAAKQQPGTAFERASAVRAPPAFAVRADGDSCAAQQKAYSAVATFLHGVHAVKDRGVEKMGRAPACGFTWPRGNNPDPHLHVRFRAPGYEDNASGRPEKPARQYLPAFVKTTPGPGQYETHVLAAPPPCFSGSRRQLMDAAEAASVAAAAKEAFEHAGKDAPAVAADVADASAEPSVEPAADWAGASCEGSDLLRDLQLDDHAVAAATAASAAASQSVSFVQADESSSRKPFVDTYARQRQWGASRQAMLDSRAKRRQAKVGGVPCCVCCQAHPC